jgi:hypothetical protein
VTIEALIEDYSEQIRRAASEKRYSDLERLLDEYGERVGEMPGLEDRIAQELQTISQDPCREDAQYWVIAAFHHLSGKYVPSICKILEYEHDCAVHEWYVDLLIEIVQVHDVAGEQCIPSLRKALKYDFPSDPGHALHIMILQALATIGTEEALAIVQSYVDSPNFKLREAARAILDLEDANE